MCSLKGTQRLRVESSGGYPLYFKYLAEPFHNLSNKIPPLISMYNLWTAKPADELLSQSNCYGCRFQIS